MELEKLKEMVVLNETDVPGKNRALGHLRESRALIRDEQRGSRELSIVLTKIDEAILWLQEAMSIEAQPINESGD